MTDPLDPTRPTPPPDDDGDGIIDFNTLADPEEGGSAALRLPGGQSSEQFFASFGEAEAVPEADAVSEEFPEADALPVAEAEALPVAEEAVFADDIPDATAFVLPPEEAELVEEAEPVAEAADPTLVSEPEPFAEPLLLEEAELIEEAEPVAEAYGNDTVVAPIPSFPSAMPAELIEEAEPVAEAFAEAEPIPEAEAEPLLLAEPEPEAAVEAEAIPFAVEEAEATWFAPPDGVADEPAVAEAVEPSPWEAPAADVLRLEEPVAEAEPLAEAHHEATMLFDPVADPGAELAVPADAWLAEADSPDLASPPEVVAEDDAAELLAFAEDDAGSPDEDAFSVSPSARLPAADDEDAFSVAGQSPSANLEDDAVGLGAPPSQVGQDDAFSPTSGVLFGGSDEDALGGEPPASWDDSAAPIGLGLPDEALPGLWEDADQATQADPASLRLGAGASRGLPYDDDDDADDLLATLGSDPASFSPSRGGPDPEDPLAAFDHGPSDGDSSLDLLSASHADINVDPNPSHYWADQNSSVDLLSESDVERPNVSDSGTVTLAEQAAMNADLPGLDLSGAGDEDHFTEFEHQDSASVQLDAGSQPEFLDLAGDEDIASPAVYSPAQEEDDLLGLPSAGPSASPSDNFETVAFDGGAADDPFAPPASDVRPSARATAKIADDEPAPAKKRSRAPVVDDDAPVGKSRPPAKSGGGGFGLVLGLLGLLVGAGGVAGAWFAGLLPNGPNTGTPIVDGNKTEPRSEDVVKRGRALLDAGALGEAVEELKRSSSPNVKPYFLLANAQKTWLDYVRERQAAGEKLDVAAEPVKAALKELQESNLPQGILWQGLILESVGDYEGAGKLYKDAAIGHPDMEKVFQTATDRMELLRPGEGLAIPEVRRPIDPAIAFVLAAFLLQADGDLDEEPGFAFWLALKKATEADAEKDAAKRADLFKRAGTLLGVAKAAHIKRATGLRRGLNPQSDPLEQIFPRCCDELAMLWEAKAEFYKRNYDAARSQGFVKAVGSTVGGPDPTVVAKLKEAGFEDADFGKAVDAIITAKKKADDDYKTALDDKKKADDALTALAKTLTDAGFDAKEDAKDALDKALAAGKTAADALKKVGTRVEAAGLKDTDPAKAVDMLAAGKKDADTVVAGVVKQLQDKKFLGDEPKPAEVAEALGKALEAGTNPAVSTMNKLGVALAGVGGEVTTGLSKAIDAGGQVAASQAAAARAQLLLSKARGPGQMLDLWLAVLPEKASPEDATAALADADLIAADAGSSPADQAKALAVRALALKAKGDLAGAREALTKAAAHPGFPKDAPWAAPIKDTTAGLADSGALVKRAQSLLADDDFDRARAVVEEGLKAFPADAYGKDHGRLLALRALVSLEQNRTADARTDAEAAVKAGAAAEGNLALGRVTEAAGDLLAAERAYNAAIKAAAGDPGLVGQAELGLVRVARKKRAKPAPKPAAPAVGLLDRAATWAVALVLLAPPADEPPADPEADGLTPAQVEELRRLNRAIAGGLPDAKMEKVRWLTDIGRYSQALNLFADALAEIKNGKEYADDLKTIMTRHPLLQEPDAAAKQNASTGEKRYSAGVNLYHAGRFEEAEKSLLDAVRHFKGDARYYYYLGLTRLALGRDDVADKDFEKAGLLETENRPGPREVGRALERIQGPLRRKVDQYRP